MNEELVHTFWNNTLNRLAFDVPPDAVPAVKLRCKTVMWDQHTGCFIIRPGHDSHTAFEAILRAVQEHRENQS